MENFYANGSLLKNNYRVQSVAGEARIENLISR